MTYLRRILGRIRDILDPIEAIETHWNPALTKVEGSFRIAKRIHLTITYESCYMRVESMDNVPCRNRCHLIKRLRNERNIGEERRQKKYVSKEGLILPVWA